MLGWMNKSGETAKDLKETLVALSFSTFGVLLTGIIIGSFTDSFRDFPALLILIPPAIDMRGNIFASLGSRLGTYLHTGEVSIDKKSEILNENIFSSFNLTFSMSFYLGFLVWVIASYIGNNLSLISIILISYLAGFLSAVVMTLFTFTIAFASYRKGWNPDNVTAPLITLAGDIFTLPFLLLSFNIVIKIGEGYQMFMLLIFILATVASFYPLKMENFRRIVIESFPVFIICGLLSSLSGNILGSHSHILVNYATILVILPAFLEDGGAIGGVLSARFSSALHTGEIKYGKIPKKVLRVFLDMHLIGAIVFPIIGIFGYLIGMFFSFNVNVIKIVMISFIAGELLIFIVNLLSFYISTVSFKMGINPDNVAIPILTSLMDFVGTACLIGVAFILGFA